MESNSSKFDTINRAFNKTQRPKNQILLNYTHFSKKGKLEKKNFIKSRIITKNILKIYTIIFFIAPIFSMMNAKGGILSGSSYIILKFISTGSQQILYEGFGPDPDHIYINNNPLTLTEPTKIVTINDLNDKVKIEWDNPIDNCLNMFNGLSNLAEVDLSNFDSSTVINTASMFSGCTSLTSINFANFKTSLITDMTKMFLGCDKLISLDLTNFDTSKVTRLAGFVQHCPTLESLNFMNFNTSSVNSMNSMFRESERLTVLDLSSFDTSRVTDMGWMFGSCKRMTSVVLTSFNTISVQKFNFFFEFCINLEEIHISHFNTSNCDFFGGMFRDCNKITELNITNFDTRKATSMTYMFLGYKKLTSLNITNFDTSKVEDMNSMFKQCEKLTTLDLSKFDVSNVKNMKNMFGECKSFTSLNLSNFYTPKCQEIHGIFAFCENLESLEIPNIRTSLCVTLNDMFSNCYKLTSVDVSSLDTSQVTNMYNMFVNCKKLTSLNLSNFVTTKLKNMNYSSAGCNSLTSLNLSNFDVSQVETLESTFQSCTSLKVLYIQNFYTRKCTNLRGMFAFSNNLRFINFFNYIEVDDSVFNNIINGDRSDLIICINITEQHRMYQELNGKCIIGCYFPEESDTVLVNNIKVSTEKEKASTNIIEYSSSSSSFSSSNIIETEEKIHKNKSSQTLDGSITENLLSTYISQNYIKINDSYYFFGYNNSQIYAFILESLSQYLYQNVEQKPIFKGIGNFIFQISTDMKEIGELNRRMRSFNDLSIIDLGECKNKLIERYFPNARENISFIILKYEKETNISSEKNIQYEIYEPFNFTKLDISICQETKIDIYIQTYLDEDTQKLLEELEKLGYDVFNIDDPFYNDICTKFSTEGGTDISLQDRKNYIYEKLRNKTSCQKNCEFYDYLYENGKLVCKCGISENIDLVNNEKFNLKETPKTSYDT